MPILQDVFYQFKCSITGKHTVSEKAEEELFNSKDKILETNCIRCGTYLKLEICPDRPDSYKVIEYPSSNKEY